MKNDSRPRMQMPMMLRSYETTITSLPFVGTNAPMTVEEVRMVGQTYKAVEALMPPEARGNIQPFLGLMVSEKILSGTEKTSRWANQYPDIDQIPVLMDAARDEGMHCIIHYNTKNPNLCAELEALERRWRRVPDGWQLNVVWPDPRELDRYLQRISHARVSFIAQVGGKAYNMVNRRPDFMARRLTDYAGLASYFLFDLSGGEGKLLDVEAAEPVVEAIYERLGGGVVVAGGLGPETVELLEPLVERFPFLSWDAQGRLRDTEDNLDIDAVGEYLRKSYRLFDRAWRQLLLPEEMSAR